MKYCDVYNSLEAVRARLRIVTSRLDSLEEKETLRILYESKKEIELSIANIEYDM
jgi:hypothetical protein